MSNLLAWRFWLTIIHSGKHNCRSSVAASAPVSTSTSTSSLGLGLSFARVSECFTSASVALLADGASAHPDAPTAIFRCFLPKPGSRWSLSFVHHRSGWYAGRLLSLSSWRLCSCLRRCNHYTVALCAPPTGRAGSRPWCRKLHEIGADLSSGARFRHLDHTQFVVHI